MGVIEIDHARRLTFSKTEFGFSSLAPHSPLLVLMSRLLHLSSIKLRATRHLPASSSSAIQPHLAKHIPYTYKTLPTKHTNRMPLANHTTPTLVHTPPTHRKHDVHEPLADTLARLSVSGASFGLALHLPTPRDRFQIPVVDTSSRLPIGDARPAVDGATPAVDDGSQPDIDDGRDRPEALECGKTKGKGVRTYQPNVLQRKRTHGFLKRLSTKAGRKTLERRVAKGRWVIAVT